MGQSRVGCCSAAAAAPTLHNHHPPHPSTISLHPPLAYQRIIGMSNAKTGPCPLPPQRLFLLLLRSALSRVGARMRNTVDFVIAGAGVVGVHVARRLLQLHPACTVALVDRAYAAAHHLAVQNCDTTRRYAAGSQASAANSGVVHAGVYYGSDSHKAAFCVRGNAAMKEFCK